MNLRKQKVAKKRKEMFRSAAKVVTNKGYDRATMEDIAAELLMTKGALYYYFDNKEDLIFQCHDLILSEALNEIEEIASMDLSPELKLEKAIKTHIDYAINEKEMFNMILVPEHTFVDDHLKLILEKRKRYTSVFDRIIEEGINKEDFKTSDSKMIRMIILGAMNWIQTWYSPRGGRSAEEIAETYSDLLLKLLS
ncbi:MAG TPA: TetR/AcrR family transcriptional regulator [Bacillales bacterium]|nr:TetR/AcrR family transcriptional regulator [Bacillales bacterium]